MKETLLRYLMMKNQQNSRQLMQSHNHVNRSVVAVGVETELVVVEASSIEADAFKMKCSAGEVDAEWLRFLEANNEEVVVS